MASSIGTNPSPTLSNYDPTISNGHDIKFMDRGTANPATPTLNMQKVRDPEYKDIQRRLETFFIFIYTYQSAKFLASAGYRYKHEDTSPLALNPTKASGIYCFSCNHSFTEKQNCSDIWKSHAQANPNCEFLKSVVSQEYIDAVQADRKNKQMIDFALDAVRLATFIQWPYDLQHQPEYLAKKGFSFTGNQGEAMCEMCGQIFSFFDCKRGESLHEMHYRIYPESKCAWANRQSQKSAGNRQEACQASVYGPSLYLRKHDKLIAEMKLNEQFIPVNGQNKIVAHIEKLEGGYHSTSYSKYFDKESFCEGFKYRISTFDNNWPSNMEQTPEDMAAAGFVRTGFKDDEVACYCCNKDLSGWQSYEIPWVEHQRFSPGCPLAIAWKETNKMQQLKYPKQASLINVKYTKGIAEIMEMGYSRIVLNYAYSQIATDSYMTSDITSNDIITQIMSMEDNRGSTSLEDYAYNGLASEPYLKFILSFYSH